MHDPTPSKSDVSFGVALLVIEVVFASALLAPAAAAQSAEENVRGVIDRFFEGMRTGDSTLVREALHREARFQTAIVRDGYPLLQTGDIERFVAAVGTPREQVWDEKIWDVEVRIDGHLAQAWMSYAFFLDDDLSHCGANAFQLYHDGSSWKIIQLTDTRRGGGCELPDDF